MKFKMRKFGGEKSSVFGAAKSALGGSCPKCGKLYAIVGRVHRCEPIGSAVTVVETSGSTSGTETEPSGPVVPSVVSGSKFDRALYQRRYMKGYMKKWRAKKRSKRLGVTAMEEKEIANVARGPSGSGPAGGT